MDKKGRLAIETAFHDNRFGGGGGMKTGEKHVSITLLIYS